MQAVCCWCQLWRDGADARGWVDASRCAMPYIWCACTVGERCRASVCTALCWGVAKRLTGTGTGTGLSMYLSTSRSTGLQDTQTNHTHPSVIWVHTASALVPAGIR